MNPIELNHVPQWISRRFQARDGVSWKTYAWHESFLDHFGSVKAPGVPKRSRLFAAEPYHLYVPQLAEFCRRYGLWATVSPHSEWNPGQTLRITFRPTETTLSDLSGLCRHDQPSPELPDGWLEVDDGIEWHFEHETCLSVRREGDES